MGKLKFAEDIILNELEQVELEERLSRLKEIAYHGCVSGTVGEVIYYHQTKQLFIDYMDDILEFIDEYEEETGVKVQFDDYASLPNDAVWFVIDETANIMLVEMELQGED